MSATKTIAFFGATGGCTNACLSYLLKSDLNYTAIALARTPQKLIDSLLRQPGMTESIISKKLTIIQGDATDVSAVKKTLVPLQQGRLVDGIISGIGGTLTHQQGTLFSFTIPNPNITEQAATTLMTALRELYTENGYQYSPQSDENKPVVTFISTTGLTSSSSSNTPEEESSSLVVEKEDVPFGFRYLYHSLLAVPHADKRKMEKVVSLPENMSLFKGVVIARPSLLTGDGNLATGKGLAKVRVGTEDQPAVGYLITRTDVGEWIWEEVCKKGGSKWFGRKVTLTN